MRGNIQGPRRRCRVNKVGVSFDCYECSVKFRIKWGAGVATNESAEGCICSSRAATAETIPQKASPANSLACPCEPFIDSAAA